MFQQRAAKAVIQAFNKLPSKSKPRSGPDCKEWVPLTGIIVEHEASGQLEVASLATGMKCLPHSKVGEAAGLVLHDSHAEILAMRAFNYFLLMECKRVLQNNEYKSPYIQVRPNRNMDEQVFMVNEKVHLHMFSTEPPCGDASMEHIQSFQSDATPWENAENNSSAFAISAAGGQILRGRGHFSNVGCVRTKPGRADSPPTLSKSCTDKLALRQALSLLQTPTYLLMRPSPAAYLRSIILPLESFHSEACKRAFGSEGRLQKLNEGAWSGDYAMNYFDVNTVDMDELILPEHQYAFSRTKVSEAMKDEPIVGSNISTIYLPLTCPPIHETLINGVLQGRKAFSGKGGSVICKKHMWRLALGVAQLSNESDLLDTVDTETYEQLKSADCRLKAERQAVKNDIRGLMAESGWIRNGGNEFSRA